MRDYVLKKIFFSARVKRPEDIAVNLKHEKIMKNSCHKDFNGCLKIKRANTNLTGKINDI